MSQGAFERTALPWGRAMRRAVNRHGATRQRHEGPGDISSAPVPRLDYRRPVRVNYSSRDMGNYLWSSTLSAAIACSTGYSESSRDASMENDQQTPIGRGARKDIASSRGSACARLLQCSQAPWTGQPQQLDSTGCREDKDARPKRRPAGRAGDVWAWR
jgi:hypothetical protein